MEITISPREISNFQSKKNSICKFLVGEIPSFPSKTPWHFRPTPPPGPIRDLRSFTPQPVPRAEGGGGQLGRDEFDLRRGEAVLRRILFVIWQGHDGMLVMCLK